MQTLFAWQILQKPGILFISSFSLSTNACKRTDNFTYFSKLVKIKNNCQCFVREESNPYTSCQGAELKEGSISHKAGSLDHVPEGFGTGLQNVYRKKQCHKKPNPAKEQLCKAGKLNITRSQRFYTKYQIQIVFTLGKQSNVFTHAKLLF